MMIITRQMALLAVCGALALSAGCSQNTDTAPPLAKDTGMAAETTGQLQQPAEIQKPAEPTKAAGSAQVAETTNAAGMPPLVADAQERARIQSLIDSVKSLTGESKYAEALKILGDLAKLKLTPEQLAWVNGMKETAQKQMAQAATDQAAAGAAKAVGGVLGGQK